MEEAIFCPKCGRKSEGDRFCRACGTHLAPVSEALSTSQSTGRFSLRRGRTTAVLFKETALSNEEKVFNGRSVVAVFGTFKIDLTAAPLPPGETRINVYSLFAEGEIMVPDDVAVRVEGFSFLANLKVRGQTIHDSFLETGEYASPDYDRAVRRLRVEVKSAFAEVKIKR